MPDTATASFRIKRRLRWLVAAAAALFLIAAALIGLGLAQLLRPGQDDAAVAGVFAPAREGEFLVVVAPFRRAGGEPLAVGGVVANELRQIPDHAELYRVELLPRAVDEQDIASIVTSYSPRIVLAGTYDASNILGDLLLFPPDQPPPSPPAITSGGAALFPDLAPQRFSLYAPRGLERPLLYLESWIVGQSYFWRGDYAQAMAPLQRSRQLLPPSVPIANRSEMDRFAAHVNWQIGYIAGPAQGNWQAARDLFAEALRLAPNDPAPALGLAASLAQLGELGRAEDILRRSLRTHPEAWQIYFALAEIDLQQGQVAEAYANYERAIALLNASPEPAAQQMLADIYFNRGFFRLSQGDPGQALPDLQQALARGREDVYVQSSLAWAAYLLADYETAVRASAAARRLAPDRPDLAFNEALHLLAAGQIEAARVAYDEAIQLTLTIDEVLTRSTYFGIAHRDLAELAGRQPDLAPITGELQERIVIANG